jgi:hypothetical protein
MRQLRRQRFNISIAGGDRYSDLRHQRPECSGQLCSSHDRHQVIRDEEVRRQPVIYQLQGGFAGGCSTTS